MLAKEGFEADDIIAVAHREIRKNDPYEPILIMTNDNDYIQLSDVDTRIVNAKDQDIVERVKNKNNVPMDVFLEWKIILGDSSDNIPSIAKRIGEKTALKLATNKELLQKKLEEKEVRDQYDLNKKLISFENIPDDIVEGIKMLFAEIH